MKIAFSFFLSIYSRCGAPASLAALHTTVCLDIYNLIQNSRAVKNECDPEKGYSGKRCEIQGGGQEMAVMVG